MTEHLKQSISALLDEEISEIEVHRLLREFDSDDSLKETWVRYQQIRAVSQSQHHLSETQHLDLYSRISGAIDEEDHHEWQGDSRPAWQKQTAGLAVAASLVMAVFVGINVQEQKLNPESDLVASGETTIEASAVAAEPVSNVMEQPEEMVAFNDDELELRELDEAKRQQLREYLMRHDRSSQLNQMNNQTQTVTFPAQPSGKSPRQN